MRGMEAGAVAVMVEVEWAAGEKGTAAMVDVVAEKVDRTSLVHAAVVGTAAAAAAAGGKEVEEVGATADAMEVAAKVE